MGVAVGLLCILVANGSYAEPRTERCEEPKFLIARCTKATIEEWERLKAFELDWARVDRNTFCLKVK